jgi:hypothetical protein
VAQDHKVFATHTGVVDGNVNNNYFAHAETGPAPHEREDDNDGARNQRPDTPSHIIPIVYNREYITRGKTFHGRFSVDFCRGSVFGWDYWQCGPFKDRARTEPPQSEMNPSKGQPQYMFAAMCRLKHTPGGEKTEYKGDITFFSPNQECFCGRMEIESGNREPFNRYMHGHKALL